MNRDNGKLPILVVDDDPPVAHSLRRLFQRAGFDVLVAGGGKEAIAFLKSSNPAVVISDYRMPDISGIEVLKQARKLCPEAVRILISGYSEEGAFDRSSKADVFFTFFAKPWDNATLVAEVRRRTAKRTAGLSDE